MALGNTRTHTSAHTCAHTQVNTHAVHSLQVISLAQTRGEREDAQKSSSLLPCHRPTNNYDVACSIEMIICDRFHCCKISDQSYVYSLPHCPSYSRRE